MSGLGPDSIVWLVEASPRDPDTATPVTLRWSDARFCTRATDTPSHTPYDQIVADALNLSVKAWRQVDGVPVYGGVASVAVAPIELYNAGSEDDPETRQLTYLADWGWDDARVVIRRGTTEWDSNTARWVPVALVEFEVVFDGVALDFDPGGSGRARIRVAEPAERLRVPVQASRYTGFGAAVRFGSGGSGEVPHAAAMSAATGAITLAVLVRPSSVAIAAGANLLTKQGGGSNVPYLLRVNGAGNWQARLETTAGASTVAMSAAVADAWVWVGLTWDGATIARFVRPLGATTYTTWSTVAHAGTIVTNSQSVWIGAEGYDVAEVRWYGEAFTADALATRLAAPIDTDGTAALVDDSAIVYVPFVDRYGAAASEVAEELDVELVAGTWIATGEGGPDLAGVPRPLALGPVWQVPAVAVDRQLGVYAVNCREVERVRFLYAGLVGLAGTKSVTSSAVNFNGVAERIRCSDADLEFVEGQDVAVSGSASNNGTLEVLQIYPNRRVLGMVTNLTTEGVGASVTLSTTTPDWDDLGDGLVEITGAVGADVTADVLGDAEGGYVETAEDVVVRLLTEFGPLLDPSDLTDTDELGSAPVGVWVGPEERDTLELVDEIALPLGVAVLPEPDGTVGFRAIVAGGPAVDEFVKDEIRGFERVLVPPPPREVALGFRRAHLVNTDPVEAAAAYVKEFAAEEYRTETYPPVPDTAMVALHPRSQRIEMSSPLDARSDAATAAAAIHGRGAWPPYKCELLARGWGLRIGDAITVTHPDHGAAAGVDMVVVGYEKVASTNTVTVELARPPA